MPSSDAFHIAVDSSDSGKRLDVLIATRMANLSRSRAAHLILTENIYVNDALKKPGYRVCAGDQIQGTIPEPESASLEPEPIEINILYEDRDLIVINKQAGIVVHPAPGHASGTLVNALLYHCPDLEPIGGELRPGIVHRLDKDTTGVLVVAKNSTAHAHLSEQFSERNIQKTYLALVYGQMPAATGRIDLPIGRHPVDRKRMSTVSRKARPAETTWKVRERFSGVSYLELNLKTGRTHQARVHCAAIRHAIVGDPVYGGRKVSKNLADETFALIKDVDRQMLHAWCLEFLHPATDKPLVFTAALPSDMNDLINRLKAYP
jgi:23S rRNA pseudouridine1911/1915/1917 synthase